MIFLIALGVLAVIVLAALIYGGSVIHNMQMGYCKPFTHHWNITKVSVPAFDMRARGELYRCKNCPKVMAK